MQVSKVENKSDQNLKLELAGGASLSIPPGGIVENADVTNIDSIRQRVNVTMDLVEVKRNEQKQRLNG